MQVLICTHCSVTFSPKRINYRQPNKFCSYECSKLHRTPKLNKCLNCCVETKNQKFCCQSCAASFNNKGVQRYKAKPRTCKLCNNVVSGRKKYCSSICWPKTLKLTPEEKKARNLRIHREAWQRYNAKLKNQTPEDADIKAIQSFYLGCPDGYEVDHIIPISKGGLHCLSNLQYLTISENRKKSNKL